MSDKIICPSCGHNFDVEKALSEALSGKLEANFKAEYERKKAELIERYNAGKRELENELSRAIKLERRKIERSTSESYEERIKSLQEENEKQKGENKSLREREVLLMRREATLKEQQENLSLRMEKEFLERQREIEDKARAKERGSFELERMKLLKQIEDNKKLAEEMKRKAEQGSMQLQGEVQELALEKLLVRSYPFDKIREIPKGVRGADCIQKVINSVQQECGTIVYESKRTKHFADEWIDKLKQDQVICKADIAVLVTQAMPSNMDRFGERKGVWICGFHEVGSLSFVLREMLIKMKSVKVSQENKGDKMELLYNYLTSNEFIQVIKITHENYSSMLAQLNSEKKAMHKIWASREKQIWVVQENLSILFGSIKGIVGKALETPDVLELSTGK